MKKTVRTMCWGALGALFAFTSHSADDLQIAREALRDGLWSTARTHAMRANCEEGELVVLESFANENRWKEIGEVLSKSPWADASTNRAYQYYRAASEGKTDDAIALLRQSGSRAGEAEAKMLEAQLFVAKGETASAERLWREVAVSTNASERSRAVASVNLRDVAILKKTYSNLLSASLKHLVGLRLGSELLRAEDSSDEGEKLIRAIVSESPDADGAREAFVALVQAAIRAKDWKKALRTAGEATDMWPEAARLSVLHECRGTALHRLGQAEDALASLTRAAELATDREDLARIHSKEGEALTDCGRGEEAMEKYRRVLKDFPETATATALKVLVALREKESKGREYYQAYQFEDAREIFLEVAKQDPSRRNQMYFNEVLCLYGLGRDEEALQKATRLAETCPDLGVRADAVLWLAKLTYNRGDFKDAVRRFQQFADLQPKNASAPSALLWAARAAFSANDLPRAIQFATRLFAGYPSAKESADALIIQSEALIEQARFDEAILVLEQVSLLETASSVDKIRAGILKGDAYFALGADNALRYESALEIYRSVVLSPEISPSLRLQVSFKVGRVLEKMKRVEEAIDEYYSQVILAYRDGRMRGLRFDDAARAAFSRAAFRLADVFEARRRDRAAHDILKLVVESAVPATDEAAKRMERIEKKGRFL